MATGCSRRAKPGQLELQNRFRCFGFEMGVLLAAVLVGSAVAREAFGSSGFVVTAAISGFVDVDAINLAATRLASNGELDLDVAVLAITVAVASNTIVKGAIAWVSGGRSFGADIAKVFGLAMAGGIPWLWQAGGGLSPRDDALRGSSGRRDHPHGFCPSPRPSLHPQKARRPGGSRLHRGRLLGSGSDGRIVNQSEYAERGNSQRPRAG